MPLTEREKQILQEIERNLYAEDPAAAATPDLSPRTRIVRRIRLGAGLFVLGLAILVAFFFTENPLVGVLAFGSMVGGAVFMASGASRLAADGINRMQGKERVEGTWRSLRERYRRR